MFEIAFTFMCWNSTHWEKINCGKIERGRHIEYVCEKPIYYKQIFGKSVCFADEVKDENSK